MGIFVGLQPRLLRQRSALIAIVYTLSFHGNTTVFYCCHDAVKPKQAHSSHLLTFLEPSLPI